MANAGGSRGRGSRADGWSVATRAHGRRSAVRGGSRGSWSRFHGRSVGCGVARGRLAGSRKGRWGFVAGPVGDRFAARSAAVPGCDSVALGRRQVRGKVSGGSWQGRSTTASSRVAVGGSFAVSQRWRLVGRVRSSSGREGESCGGTVCEKEGKVCE